MEPLERLTITELIVVHKLERRMDRQMFVLRALGHRAKIFGSSAAEGTVRFDVNVVQDAFKNIVKTGLKSDQIRMRLGPVLSDPNRKDDELSAEFSDVSYWTHASTVSAEPVKPECTPGGGGAGRER